MNPMHKRWLAVAAGTSLALLTARLGVWQLDRAAQKIALAEQGRQRADAPPWSGRDWPCAQGPVDQGARQQEAASPPGTATESASLPAQQPVHLRGRWLSQHTVFLDNRPMDGQAGFFVVTPLKLSDSACPGGIVLVQRGWWPRDAQDRQRLPDWSDADGEIELRGTVLPHVSRTFGLGDEGPPPREAHRTLRQNVDDAFWRAWLGQSPLPGAVLQGHPEAMTSASPAGFAPPGLRRDWPQPDLGVDKHRAYAAQWFALSALSLGLTLWFSVLRPRRARRPDAG
jgi:surfeit locus 1 family protein